MRATRDTAVAEGRARTENVEGVKRENGSQSRTRTCNLAINSRLLCQLSYLGMNRKA